MNRTIPEHFLHYKTMEITPQRINFLRNRHNTKTGTWGQINLTTGEGRFEILDFDNNVHNTEVVTPDKKVVVPPAVWHRLIPSSDSLQGSIHFYCHPDYYFYKKYQLSKPHSDVVRLNNLYLKTLFNKAKSINVLDMGSGRGRNSLYLSQHGCTVSAVDINSERIEILKDIIHKEHISQVTPYCNDLTTLQLDYRFDVILLNVVLQFIEKELSLQLIEKAKKHTRPGGLHSIVCPVETPGITWPEHFRCVLQPEQLKNLYVNDAWAILEYNEDFGNLHVPDENGLPKRGRFASIICQKTLDNAG